MIVAVTGRKHHALNAETHRIVEEISNVARVFSGIQRAIGRNPETALARLLDRRHGFVEHTVPANGLVVTVLVAVEMDRPSKVRRRLVFVHFLLEQQRIRAQVDELLALDQTLDDLRHLLVNQRLAARDRHDWGPAFFSSAQRIVDTHPLSQDVIRIVDLAAAGTGPDCIETKARA